MIFDKRFTTLAFLAVSLPFCAPMASDAKTEPAPIDACKLLSSEDIAAITGKKVGAPIPTGAGTSEDGGSYSSTCVWKIPGDDSATVDAPLQGKNFAMLNAWSWTPGNDGARKFVQDFRDASKNNLIDATPVPVQVGDEALYWGDGVAVRKGTFSFGVSVHLVGEKPAEQSMETALAKKILERLSN